MEQNINKYNVTFLLVLLGWMEIVKRRIFFQRLTKKCNVALFPAQCTLGKSAYLVVQQGLRKACFICQPSSSKPLASVRLPRPNSALVLSRHFINSRFFMSSIGSIQSSPWKAAGSRSVSVTMTFL